MLYVGIRRITAALIYCMKSYSVVVAGRFIRIIIRLFTDDIAGSVLALHVDLSDVLADDAERQHLQTAGQENDDHRTGPARDSIAHEAVHDRPDDADKTEE